MAKFNLGKFLNGVAQGIGGFVSGNPLLVASGITGGLDALFGEREQARGAKEAGAAERFGLSQAMKEYAPFREAGLRGLGRIEKLLGTRPLEEGETIENLLMDSPLFQRIREDQLEQVKRRLAGSGLLRSGRGARIMEEASGRILSSQYQPQLSALSGLAGFGTQMASPLASLAVQTGRSQAQQRRSLGMGTSGLFNRIGNLLAQGYGLSRGLSGFKELFVKGVY